jgi:hypothetical protein
MNSIISWFWIVRPRRHWDSTTSCQFPANHSFSASFGCDGSLTCLIWQCDNGSKLIGRMSMFCGPLIEAKKDSKLTANNSPALFNKLGKICLIDGDICELFPIWLVKSGGDLLPVTEPLACHVAVSQSCGMVLCGFLWPNCTLGSRVARATLKFHKICPQLSGNRVGLL